MGSAEYDLGVVSAMVASVIGICSSDLPRLSVPHDVRCCRDWKLYYDKR